jgi:hypothetical protein
MQDIACLGSQQPSFPPTPMPWLSARHLRHPASRCHAAKHTELDLEKACAHVLGACAEQDLSEKMSSKFTTSWTVQLLLRQSLGTLHPAYLSALHLERQVLNIWQPGRVQTPVVEQFSKQF